MTIHKNALRLLAVIMITTGLGLFGAPANAYVSYGYSNGAWTWSGCQPPQDRAIALKRAQGYQITRVSKCVRNSSGYWNGYFRYSKGGWTYN